MHLKCMHQATGKILLEGYVFRYIAIDDLSIMSRIYPILKPPNIILCLMLRLIKHSTDNVMRKGVVGFDIGLRSSIGYKQNGVGTHTKFFEPKRAHQLMILYRKQFSILWQAQIHTYPCLKTYTDRFAAPEVNCYLWYTSAF